MHMNVDVDSFHDWCQDAHFFLFGVTSPVKYCRMPIGLGDSEMLYVCCIGKILNFIRMVLEIMFFDAFFKGGLCDACTMRV